MVDLGNTIYNDFEIEGGKKTLHKFVSKYGGDLLYGGVLDKEKKIYTGNEGLDKLISYETSTYSKSKEELIRNIVKDTASVLKVSSDFHNKPIETIVKELRI